MKNETKLLEQFNNLKSFDKSFDIAIDTLCGLDEAGRGPFIGPVYAACVILPENCDILELNDSKKIKEETRFEIAEKIKKQATAYGIGFVDEKTIDEIGIQKSNFLAFKIAYENMIKNFDVNPKLSLIDGNYKGIDIENHITVVKGDSKSLCISAASILAKTERDKFVIEVCHKEFPEYAFDKNKGYGTKSHIEAIKKYGLTKWHRKSFCKKFL